MNEKIETLDLTSEEMAKRFFGREVAIVFISKRIKNDDKMVHGWRVEFAEKKNQEID